MTDHEAPSTPPRRVFISHVATDEAWAQAIASRLGRDGVSVSLPRDIAAGAPIAESIRDVLASADDVIVLLSERSSASPWVVAEMNAAVSAGKNVVPVRIEVGAPIPSSLARFAYLDAAELGAATTTDRIADAVGGHRDFRVGDGVPASPLPPISSDTWLLRADELAQIEDAFRAADGQATARTVVVVGPPGAGKTTLARQYVGVHQDDYEVIRWVSFRPGSDVEMDDKSDAGGRRSLLVIDDVDSYHEIAATLPHDPRVDVLLTSRNRAWGPPFEVLHLGEFTMTEATDFLLRRLPEMPVSDVSQLVRAVGGLPLTLTIAASIAEEYSVESLLHQLSALTTTISAAGMERRGFYYLDTNDPSVISEFERAFAEAIAPNSDLDYEAPERGSWRRRWSERYNPDRIESLIDKAERAAEVAALSRPEGQANRDNAEAIARLLESSSAIPNIVIASGSVLFIKITDISGCRVFSKTLTATELRRFEQNQHALSKPADALAFLDVLSTDSGAAAPTRRIPDHNSRPRPSIGL